MRAMLILVWWALRALLARLTGRNTVNYPRQWAEATVAASYPRLGLTVEILDDFFFCHVVSSEQSIVVFGPHPLSYALPALVQTLAKSFPGRQIVPVVAARHRWNPLGWGAWAVGGLIISRGSRARAVQAIKRRVERNRDRGLAPLYLIFCDGSRPFAERRSAVLAYFHNQGFYDLAADDLYVLAPRPAGLLAFMECLPRAVFVETAVAVSPWAESAAELRVRQKRDRQTAVAVRFRLCRVPLAVDKESIKHWLYRRWVDISFWILSCQSRLTRKT